jgi:hypothetical protein
MLGKKIENIVATTAWLWGDGSDLSNRTQTVKPPSGFTRSRLIKQPEQKKNSPWRVGDEFLKSRFRETRFVTGPVLIMLIILDL